MDLMQPAQQEAGPFGERPCFAAGCGTICHSADIGQLAEKRNTRDAGTPIARTCHEITKHTPHLTSDRRFVSMPVLRSSGSEGAMTAFDLTPVETPADPRRAWAKLDQAARDAAYNNNNAVANSAALIEERNAAAAIARAARAGALDIPYADGERTRFDLYPGAAKAAPCLVFIHGGYWQRHSRELFSGLAGGALASR